MPIIKSAKKALRGSLRKKAFNDKRKKEMKNVVKEVKDLIAKKDKSAKELLPKAYKALDKAAKRGVIKKNTASRKKARLAKAVKAIA